MSVINDCYLLQMMMHQVDMMKSQVPSRHYITQLHGITPCQHYIFCYQKGLCQQNRGCLFLKCQTSMIMNFRLFKCQHCEVIMHGCKTIDHTRENELKSKFFFFCHTLIVYCHILFHSHVYLIIWESMGSVSPMCPLLCRLCVIYNGTCCPWKVYAVQ